MADRGLEVAVFDHDRLGQHELLGGVRLNLGSGMLTHIYVAVGLNDTHSFEWPFPLKFLCTGTKIVTQFVFQVQSVVFIHTFFYSGIEYHRAT